MPIHAATVVGVDKPVSRVVLGAMALSAARQEFSSELMDEALANGINAFDTAHVYAGGDTDRAIGNWMSERGNREDVVVLAKAAHPNSDRRRVTYYDIASDLHDILARLKSDYVDLLVLHRDDPDVPVGEIVEWLNEFHREGKVRAFGGSNWTHQRIIEANQYAAERGLVPFAASNPHFSLAEQVDNPWGPGCVTLTGEHDPGAREWFARTGMPIFAYSSLARGLFSGGMTRESYKEVADSACLMAYCHECNFQRLDRAGELAKERGVTVAQVALAYVLSYPLNIFALVGAQSVGEIRSCAEAADIELSPEEMAWLNLESERTA